MGSRHMIGCVDALAIGGASAAEPHERSRPHLALDVGTSCSSGKCGWHCYVTVAASVSQEGLCLYDIAAQRHQRSTPHLAVAAAANSNVKIGCARDCHGTRSREREDHKEKVKGWGGSQVRYSKHGESIESRLFSRMERGALCKHPYCQHVPPSARASLAGILCKCCLQKEMPVGAARWPLLPAR